MGLNLRARSSALYVQGGGGGSICEHGRALVQGVSRRESRVVINAHPPARHRRPSLPAVPRQELLPPAVSVLLAFEPLQRRAPLLLARLLLLLVRI